MGSGVSSGGGGGEADLRVNFASNRLLATLDPAERALLEGAATPVALSRGDVLHESGGEVAFCYFPVVGTMISLVVALSDGRSVEVATIGKEGAIGGIISCGSAPAFANAEVQIPGAALRIDMKALEAAKARSSHIRNLFCRYADALLAQVMQSVACNALHPLEARCCRWLLTAQDRAGGDSIALTQEYLAEMLGVQRTTVSGVARQLQEQGLIRYRRGTIQIQDRVRLEARACECYGSVERHFLKVLPEVRPQKVVDAAGNGA